MPEYAVEAPAKAKSPRGGPGARGRAARRRPPWREKAPCASEAGGRGPMALSPHLENRILRTENRIEIEFRRFRWIG